jgi:hypothetical protein
MSAASSTTSSFRKSLPRIYELKDAVPDPSHPDAYFRDFEDGLERNRSKLNAFLKLERWLAVLDNEAWPDLKERAAPLTMTRMPGRGWEPLFNLFSEARAYGYLADIGCTGIRFLKRTKRLTPDLAAALAGRAMFCEVKTLNISADEAEKRDRIASGEIIGGSVSITLTEGFLGKVSATLAHGVDQLYASDPERKARRLLFVVVRFDDWVGDYQPEYFACMDAHLLRNPVVGAELVFCPGSNLFDRSFAMRSAVVLSE